MFTRRWLAAVASLVLLLAAGGAYLYTSSQAEESPITSAPAVPADFTAVWFTDFAGNRVVAVNRADQVVWEQHMASPPLPPKSYNGNVEFLTIAPDGNIMSTDANGMMVQELDRATHQLVWQYGVKDQQYGAKRLHQPKKAFSFNDQEVLITDANNRRVIIIDKTTNEITWQYGHEGVMSDKPGYLKGNRFAMPLAGGQEVLISDTLTKKIIIVDRATNNILWQWEKPDAEWLQHVLPTSEGTFVAEDHLKNEVFEVNRTGEILWNLHTLADGTTLKYPTDVVKLGNGHVLVAEAGRGRIIEVDPQTKEIVWQYAQAGFPTSLAVE